MKVCDNQPGWKMAHGNTANPGGARESASLAQLSPWCAVSLSLAVESEGRTLHTPALQCCWRSALTSCAAAAPAASTAALPEQIPAGCLSVFPGESRAGSVSGQLSRQEAALACTSAPAPAPEQGGGESSEGHTPACSQTLLVSLKQPEINKKNLSRPPHLRAEWSEGILRSSSRTEHPL